MANEKQSAKSGRENKAGTKAGDSPARNPGDSPARTPDEHPARPGASNRGDAERQGRDSKDRGEQNERKAEGGARPTTPGAP